jgi:hypothetical protein
MRPRPARVRYASLTLIVVAALALVFAGLSVRGYFESAQYEGIATRMTFAEFVVDAPDQILVPIGLALAAGTAAVGMFRRREWGRIVAVAVGVAIGIGGVMLLVTALREWGLPGSYSVLLVPPGVVATLVGSFIAVACLTTASFFSEP